VIRSARRKYREQIATEICDSFNPRVVLHWYGKLLRNVTSSDLVDYLAAIVSGAGVIKVLGARKIQNGTEKDLIWNIRSFRYSNAYAS